MISCAKKQDLSQVMELWNECFPDEEDFTRYFFENIYLCENTLVLKVDEKIVAMLQMLPFSSSMGEITYIYGVATAIKFRKMGYADKLMKKSFEISQKRGHNFSVLIPAEQWLFEFYKKYGYEARFSCKTIEKNSNNPENIAKSLEKSDFYNVMEIYNQAEKGEFFIKRNQEHFEHQLNLHGDGALKYIENDTIIGYSFGYYKEKTYIIDEIYSKDIEKCLNSFEKVLCKTFGDDLKVGVIKKLSDIDLPRDGYLNLMYN